VGAEPPLRPAVIISSTAIPQDRGDFVLE